MRIAYRCRCSAPLLTLCGILALSFLWGPLAAEEKPAEPKPVELLPADSVAAIAVDFEALGGSLPSTSFVKFMTHPDHQSFWAPVMQETASAWEDWRSRYPALPSLVACTQLLSGQAAVGVRLIASGQPLVPPRAVPMAVFRLKDPQALSFAMMEVFHFMPSVRLPSGVQAQGNEGLWSILDGPWLLLAAEQEDLQRLHDFLHKSPKGLGCSARWKKLVEELGPECPAIIWADFNPVREHLLALPADANARSALPPSPAQALAALGLDGVQSIAMGFGAAGPHLDFRMALEAPLGAQEKRRGILKLLEGEGNLKAGALAQVPEDAAWFYLTRLDPKRVLPLLFEGLEVSGGDTLEAAKLKIALRGLAAVADLDLERDLLGNLGTEWLVCDAPGGAFPEALPGLACTGSVRDPASLERTLEKLFTFLAREAPPSLEVRHARFSESETSIHYLRLRLTDFSPAAAVCGQHVVFSPTLAGLRHQIRHLQNMGRSSSMQDIRSQPAFQAACRNAFGRALPVPPAPNAGEEPLPAALRYLDPARAHPSKYFATLAWAVGQLGSSVPDLLRTQESLRRARLKATLHLMAEGLRNARPPEGGSHKPLPQQPQDLLHTAGGGAAAAMDLEGIRYRVGLAYDDPRETILAYARLELSRTTAWGVLRLSGVVETLAPNAARKELNEQVERLRARQREVREIDAPVAPMGRPGAWWLSIWEQQAEAHLLAVRDGWRFVNRIDFARLPDLRKLEMELPAGLSWTRVNEWGVVSRTLTAYPLPAADLAGAGVPLALALLAWPEIHKAQRANNEVLVLSELQAIAAAQSYFRMVEWEKKQGRAFASSLQELAAHGLIEERLAMAEARPGVKPDSDHGYFFSMLPAQGKHAPGGEKSFLVDGKWSGGYALLAWPAEYPKTGRKTFMLGPDGSIYEADLFWVTQGTAEQTRRFDPDPERGWRLKE